MDNKIRIIGAGLAGSEAALWLADAGVPVDLIDMKPQKRTPAHNEEFFAELVCSNSFKSLQLHSATGLQKEELKILDSRLMQIAAQFAVPAGNALAVDRVKFGKEITQKILNHPNINFISEEVLALPTDDVVTIIATGPLTGGPLFEDIQTKLDSSSLHFFDAAAPIIDAASIDMSIAYRKSRYDKGSADYINCPFNENQYKVFYDALVHAELAPLQTSDREVVFEGCMPVEVMARRGVDTLRFGPLKPVGLRNPYNDEKPYAVVQLRQEDDFGSMYNLVGFQTRLKWPEQKRVFRLIPGLEGAEFLRFGVMHRNSYISSDKELLPSLQLRKHPRLFFAGQITGLEGYLCAIGSGNIAARNALLAFRGDEADFVLPETTMHGQLTRYISQDSGKALQPMNANFGLMPPLPERIKDKQERGAAFSNRAIKDLKQYMQTQQERF